MYDGKGDVIIDVPAVREAVEGRCEVDAAEWAAAELGFEADAAQRRVLASPARRVILNCTRQWGKSTVTAAKCVHEAVTRPGSLIVAVSPSARQSAELVRKAERFVRRLGMRVRGDGDNEVSIAFENGSRIVGLPGTEDTVRGFSAVSLLLVDEASRVPDELYVAVRPMVAVSGGTLWLMSTPRGKRGFFYETWQEGGPDWERVRVTAEECPRIPREFLAEERRTMGDAAYEQEYGCAFRDSVTAVFGRDLLDRAITREFGALRID
jgi:phage FluMu gp28-like protein